MSAPRVALISAVPSAIAPATAAIANALPEAEIWNLLDDRLLDDANAAGELNDELRQRMAHLIDHAVAGGADAILLTCSVYGPVASDVAGRIGPPVHGSDDAVIAVAVGGAFPTVLVVSTAAVPLADSLARFTAAAPPDVEVEGLLVEDAADAARVGDLRLTAAAVTAAVEALPRRPAVIALAQYSLAPASLAIELQTGVHTLDGPSVAAEALRRALKEEP